MRKTILALVILFVGIFAASAEWRTVYDSEDCGSYGIVHFVYGYDDDPDIKTFILESPDEAIDITVKETKRFNVNYIMKDVLYTKGCEYAKVYGQCLFQSSLGIIDWVFLQPNGYYTVISIKR